MKTVSHRWGIAFAAVLSSVILSTSTGLASDFWVEAGPVWRAGIKVKVAGSSYVQDLNRHAALAPLSEPNSVGPVGTYSDRTYTDGYVKLDEGTLNPDAVGGLGNTWNWTYDQESQFNAEANTLSFHQQGDIGYTTLQSTPITGGDAVTGAGIQILIGWKIYQDADWRFDIAFGFQGIWGVDSQMSRRSYMERTSRLNVTDSYNVAEVVDLETGFPQPRTAVDGYVGQYDVPGPTFTNIPSRSVTNIVLSTAENLVNFSFETSLLQFTLNPRFTYLATPRLSLTFTPSLGLSYIQIIADRTEVFTDTSVAGVTTTLGTWRDHRSDSGVRFAAGLTGGAAWDLGDGFYAGAFGGYEWAVDAVRINIGPNTASVNGSGYVVGAVLGKRF